MMNMLNACRILGLTFCVPVLALLASTAARGQEPAKVAPARNDHSCHALLPASQAARPDPAQAPRRRALLVGISRYEELGARNDAWPNIPTRCDVEIMKQALVGRFGFVAEQIEVLAEGQATRGVSRRRSAAA